MNLLMVAPICPQGGLVAGLQQEECAYVRLMKVQHQQCLEEAQTENETAGEHPPVQGYCTPEPPLLFTG